MRLIGWTDSQWEKTLTLKKASEECTFASSLVQVDLRLRYDICTNAKKWQKGLSLRSPILPRFLNIGTPARRLAIISAIA